MDVIITKSTGETVTFDISKIAEAIMIAFDKIEEELQQATEALTQGLETFLNTLKHCISHAVLHVAQSVLNCVKSAKPFIRRKLLILIIPGIIMKYLSMVFQERSLSHRFSFMMRKQDRGIGNLSLDCMLNRTVIQTA